MKNIACTACTGWTGVTWGARDARDKTHCSPHTGLAHGFDAPSSLLAVPSIPYRMPNSALAGLAGGSFSVGLVVVLA